MSNLPVQMVWIGDRVSRLEYLCMRSFTANGSPIHLYTYNQVENLPKEVICLDANEIFPKDRIFKYKGSYAIFSDLFRWKLLAQKGGYYSDTDVLCVKPLDFVESALVGKEVHNMVNSAFLKFPAQHPVVLEMLDSALNPNKIKVYDTARIKRKKLIQKLIFRN